VIQSEHGAPAHYHPTAAHKEACPLCRPNKTVPELNAAYIAAQRYMAVQLRFDRESFDALKELLREKSIYNAGRLGAEESPEHRRDREALKRVFDQIRTVDYSDV